MISDHNLGALMGAPVTGPNDEKIGTVGQVFVDPDTGRPNWVTVHTGLFGRHESFVPVEDATWDHEILHIPFDKDVVKEAPRVDTDQALSPEDEVSLYRYYRVPIGDADGDGITDRTGDHNDASYRDGDLDGDGDRDSSRSGPVAAAAAQEPSSAPHQSAAEPTVADKLAEATRRFVEKGKHGSDSSEQEESSVSQDAGYETRDAADGQASATDQESNDQASGRMRMRRYVIVEEQVPMDSDPGLPGDPGQPGAPRNS